MNYHLWVETLDRFALVTVSCSVSNWDMEGVGTGLFGRELLCMSPSAGGSESTGSLGMDSIP
jgi:hypothetical protein